MPGHRRFPFPPVAAVLAGLVALHAVVWFRNAWVGDDAYVTLRTVDNFVHGYGLRFNIAERVQTYTHPLWMLLLSAGFAVTGEGYYTTLAVSLAASLAALLVLALRVAPSPAASLAPLGVLLLSKAFVDYESSGLENPLTHLFLAVLAAEYCRRPERDASSFRLGLAAAGLALTRPDAGLLAAPALLSVLAARRSARAAGSMVLGLLPLAAWEGFSLLYYGSLVPNTAYAKLSHGVPRIELVTQGLAYVAHSFAIDPITPVTITAALALAWRRGGRRTRCMAAGAALYLAYTVLIGGCFMSGRLLSAPMFAAALVLGRIPVTGTGPRVAALAVGLVLGLAPGRSPLYTTRSYGGETDRSRFPRGIVDERGWYFPASGLVHVFPGPGVPRHRYVARGLRATSPVLVTYTLGYTAFFAPRAIHVIDPYGLADPFLARLAADPAEPWRIGHFRRAVPAGYVETLEQGHNLLEDPDLAAYYDVVSHVTRGPLRDGARLRAALRLALGLPRPPAAGAGTKAADGREWRPPGEEPRP